MNHLETKEFILYALDAAMDNAVEKSVNARYPEEVQKWANDLISLQRACEVITALPETDILCAPEIDWIK